LNERNHATQLFDTPIDLYCYLLFIFDGIYVGRKYDLSLVKGTTWIDSTNYCYATST
jgi:hypothetical protein